MAIKVYSKPSVDSALSSYGEQTNPFLITFDGRVGGARETKLYVRNDNLDRYYTGIIIQPYDLGETSIVDGTDEYSWKLYSGDQDPPIEYWIRLEPGNEISLDDIGSSTQGDISTYLPFWVRVEIPHSRLIDNTTQVYLRLKAQENLVE